MRIRQHPTDVELVSHFDGELSARSADRVSAHLQECLGCRARAEQLQAAAEIAGVSEESEVALTRRARVRLRECLATVPPVADGRQWLRYSAFIGAGCACLLALTLLVSGRLGRPKDPEPGALPIRVFTPGATRVTDAGRVCGGAGQTIPEPDETVRAQVLRDYGAVGLPRQAYELDFLITPELGGSPDRRNLWPQRYDLLTWNARVKDQLEDFLAEKVCAGELDLRTAQHDIATDWIAAYRKYFHRDRPTTNAGTLARVTIGPQSLLARPLQRLRAPVRFQ